MTATFEPSLSMSRQTMSAFAPTMADSLPNIDFGFNELRDRMAKFTIKFDAFIEQGRKRVLEERNQFRMNVAELHEDQRMKKKDIDIYLLKTTSHQTTLAKEAAETHEMQTAITSLTTTRDRHASHRDTLKSQIAATTAEIAARVAAQQAHRAAQDAQARFNIPELDFWITNLCLRIEGAGSNDRLKFVFTHLDEREWEREAWFELDMGARQYEVRHCRPKVERGRVEGVVERFNESREVVDLVKGMRELFVEAFKG